MERLREQKTANEEKEEKGKATGLEIEWKYNQSSSRRRDRADDGRDCDNGELNGGTKAEDRGRVPQD